MKTIEEFYKEWENDKHYMGDEDSWAIWFAEDWEKYKQEQCNIADVVGRSEQLVICKKCGSSEMYQYTKTKDKCEDCGNIQDY